MAAPSPASSTSAAHWPLPRQDGGPRACRPTSMVSVPWGLSTRFPWLTDAVSYLKGGGREGDLLQGLALCDKSEAHSLFVGLLLLTHTTVGKSLAYTTVSLRNGGGDLVARGSHTKYAPSPFPGAATTDTLGSCSRRTSKNSGSSRRHMKTCSRERPSSPPRRPPVIRLQSTPVSPVLPARNRPAPPTTRQPTLRPGDTAFLQKMPGATLLTRRKHPPLMVLLLPARVSAGSCSTPRVVHSCSAPTISR
jgi:hypothetical protein